MPKFRFDFAISYAGEDERVAESLANLLTNHGASVYFARLVQTRLLGTRMSREFGKAFGPKTKFFVPIISHHYANKTYALYEWEIAVRESKKRRGEFILPLRLDDTPLVGLPMDVGYADLRNISIETVSQRLIGKLPSKRKLWPLEWVATFGLIVGEIREMNIFPTSAPKDYINLCDWLTEDLLHRLRGQGIEAVEFLEDHRDGETLSIRVGFYWREKEKPIVLQAGSWWDVLEILPRKQVYG